MKQLGSTSSGFFLLLLAGALNAAVPFLVVEGTLKAVGSSIPWFSLGSALWFCKRSNFVPIEAKDTWLVVISLLLFLIPSVTVTWIVLLTACLIGLRNHRDVELQSALLLGAATAFVMLLSSASVQTLTHHLTRLDTHLIAATLVFFGQVVEQLGDGIRLVDGDLLYILDDCATHNIVPIVLLAWITLMLLRGIPMHRRHGPKILGLLLVVMLLNVARMALMAQKTWYAWLHDVPGNTVFQLILLSVTAWFAFSTKRIP